jgi:hypothetical protein
VGLDVWGLVLVDESVRPARAPLRGVPLSLAAGALVGQAVAFDPALQLVDLPDAGTWLGLAILGLVSTGLLLLSLRWIVRYLGAAAVVARHAARTSGTASRPLMVLGLGVGAGLFALWLALVLVAHLELVLILMQHPAADWLLLVLFAVASVWTIAAQPLTLMVLLGLCAMGVARARVANRARRQSADAA